MQSGAVYYNEVRVGWLTYTGEGEYIFEYADDYYHNANMPGISLTLPKTEKRYTSAILFPFFYGLLAEGINKDIQCRALKIDSEDDFTRLLKTAGKDTIGAITIKEEK